MSQPQSAMGDFCTCPRPQVGITDMPDDVHRAIHTAVQRILPRERTALGEYASILGATSRSNSRFDANIRKRERFQIVNEGRAFCESGGPQAMVDNREWANLVDAVKKYRSVLSIQTAICEALYITFVTKSDRLSFEELQDNLRSLYEAGFGEEMVSVMKSAMAHGASLDENLADANTPKIVLNPAPRREVAAGVIFDAHPERTREETKSDHQKQIMDLCRASCMIMSTLYGSILSPKDVLFSDNQRDFNSKFVDVMSEAMRIWRRGANGIINHQEYNRDNMVGYNVIKTAWFFIKRMPDYPPLSEFITGALVLCKRISSGEPDRKCIFFMNVCCKFISWSQDFFMEYSLLDFMEYGLLDEKKANDSSILHDSFMRVLIGVACDPRLNSVCHFHARDAVGCMRSPDTRRTPVPIAIKQSTDQVLRTIAFINENANTLGFEVDVGAVCYVLFELCKLLDHTYASDEKRHAYLPVVTYCVQILLSKAQEDGDWRRHACNTSYFANILEARSMVHDLSHNDDSPRTVVELVAADFAHSDADALMRLCATFLAIVSVRHS